MPKSRPNSLLSTLCRQSAVFAAAAFFSLGALAAPLQSIGPAEEPETLVIAVPDTFADTLAAESLPATIDWLNSNVPGYRFAKTVIMTADAESTIRLMQPDFIFAPAGFDGWFSADSGVRPFRIATRKTVLARNAAESVGALLVVRKERADLKTLADLRGRSVAASLPTSLSDWLAMQGELKASGYDPDRFFGSVHFLNAAYPSVLSAVLDGRVDGAVIPTCLYETAALEGLADVSGLRVIHEKTDDALGCRRSTALYPDISLSAFEWTSERAVRAVTVGILQFEVSAYYEWLSHVPQSHVDVLFRDLRVGPYAYLRELSLAGIWSRWHSEIVAALILILLLIGNEVRLQALVRRRTSELSDALSRQKASEKEAKASRLRLGSLERRNIVNQMSGMIAHEIKSPVGAICNFASILDFVLPEDVKKDSTVSTAVSGIAEEAQRIAGIVDRVRAYAKAQKFAHRPVDLVQVVRRAVQVLEMSLPEHVPVKTKLPGEAWVTGDSLELELLVLNLLKNASEALAGLKSGRILVEIRPDGSRWALSVKDNGPKLTDPAFERLSAMVESVKPEGLGLGLSIVRGIADSHGAMLAFERGAKEGLTVRMLIDRLSPDHDNKINLPPAAAEKK